MRVAQGSDGTTPGQPAHDGGAVPSTARCITATMTGETHSGDSCRCLPAVEADRWGRRGTWTAGRRRGKCRNCDPGRKERGQVR